MPRLIVTDANILIDLAEIDQHQLLFLPDWSTATTFDVFYELRDKQKLSWQPYIETGQLALEEVPEELISQIRSEVSSRLSDQDCTVIVLAESHKAIILSGDRTIAMTYRKRGYETHGILWLLDENESTGRHQPAQLHEFLTAIMAVNDWLPANECKLRIERWQP